MIRCAYHYGLGYLCLNESCCALRRSYNLSVPISLSRVCHIGRSVRSADQPTHLHIHQATIFGPARRLRLRQFCYLSSQYCSVISSIIPSMTDHSWTASKGRSDFSTSMPMHCRSASTNCQSSITQRMYSVRFVVDHADGILALEEDCS